MQKQQGYALRNTITTSGDLFSDDTYGAWLDENVCVVCDDMYSSSDSKFCAFIKTFKNTSFVTQLNIGNIDSMYNFRPWVIMKESRQILWGITSCVSYNSSGSISNLYATKIDKEANIASELSSYTWTLPENSGSVIAGVYDSDFFYSYGTSTIGSINVYKTTIDSSGIHTTLFKTLTTGKAVYYLRPFVYIPELNWILFTGDNESDTRYKNYAAYDLTLDYWVCNNSVDTLLYQYIVQLAFFKNTSIVLPKSKKLVCTGLNYAYNYIIDLTNGSYTQQSITYLTQGNYLYPLGLITEYEYPETTIMCLEADVGTYGGPMYVSMFDILTGTITRVIQIRTSGQYFDCRWCCGINYKGRMRFWVMEKYDYTSSTQYYRYSLNDYSFAHLEICDSATIYGYTIAPIKAYEQGTIYVVDTSYINTTT